MGLWMGAVEWGGEGRLRVGWGWSLVSGHAVSSLKKCPQDLFETGREEVTEIFGCSSICFAETEICSVMINVWFGDLSPSLWNENQCTLTSNTWDAQGAAGWFRLLVWTLHHSRSPNPFRTCMSLRALRTCRLQKKTHWHQCVCRHVLVRRRWHRCSGYHCYFHEGWNADLCKWILKQWFQPFLVKTTPMETYLVRLRTQKRIWRIAKKKQDAMNQQLVMNPTFGVRPTLQTLGEDQRESSDFSRGKMVFSCATWAILSSRSWVCASSRKNFTHMNLWKITSTFYSVTTNKPVKRLQRISGRASLHFQYQIT